MKFFKKIKSLFKKKEIDWLFDEHGNPIRRPMGHSHVIKKKTKKRIMKYHVIKNDE